MTGDGARARAARLARTIGALHPLQIAARPWHVVLARVVRDVPAGWGGNASRRPRREAPPALGRLAEGERERAAARLARLDAHGALAAFEAAYGLEIGDGSRGPGAPALGAAAVHPAPASVRARRLSVAARLGCPGLEREIVRAGRAILLRPEVHLLGNHLLENGLGLVCAGSALEGREADVFFALGAAILDWQLERQFLADGGHDERSASYHVWLLHGLLEAIELAEASGRGAPRKWRETASRALGFARAVEAPDGTFPLFNDAALDACPRISAVAELARELGVGVARAGDVVVREGARATHLAQTGWVVLEAPDGSRAVVDAGPDGSPDQPGHVHADALGFELWVAGRRVVVDYGVASYAPGPERRATRSTAVHSTVEVAGRDSSEVWSAFRVGRRARGEVTSFGVSDAGAFVDARHDGYAWLPGAPVHRRRVEIEAGRLGVRDVLTGGRHAATSRVRLDAETSPRLRVSARPGPVTSEPSVWYPMHGTTRPAVVLTTPVPTSKPEIEWTFEW